MLLVRRARAQTGLLATVCAVAFVLTAALAGSSGYLAISATDSVRTTLADAHPQAAALRIQGSLADEPGAQDRSVVRVIEKLFDGVPIAVHRAARHYPREIGPTDEKASETPEKVILTADADLAAHATLIDGHWPDAAAAVAPDQPAPGALQADAASALGVSVGDELVVGSEAHSRLVTVVATWKAADPTDPVWFGDPTVTTGHVVDAGNGESGYGPLVVAEANLTELGSTPMVTWTIVPDASAVTSGELPALGTAAAQLESALAADKSIGRTQVNGELGATVASLQRQLAAVEAVTPVGLLVLALIGLATLIQLAGLLVSDRRPENALLRSRGATVGLVTGAAAVEAAIAASVGAVAGYVAAVTALRTVSGNIAPPGGLEYALAVAATAVAVVGYRSWHDIALPPRRDSIDDSGRARTVATTSAAVLAIAAAGVALWQSLRYRAPLTVSAAGVQSVDVLVVLAPALVLVATALVFVVLFGPLTALVQRLSATSTGLQPAYFARQTARRLGVYSLCLLLTTLSIGGITVAAGYAGTWESLESTAAQLSAGADQRIDVENSSVTAAPIGPLVFENIPGVTAAAAVLSTGVSIRSSNPGRFTAMTQDAISNVMTTAGGAIDRTPFMALPSAPPLGAEFPADATQVELTFEVRRVPQIDSLIDGRPGPEIPDSADFGTVRPTLWVADTRGTLAALPLSAIPVRPTVESVVTSAVLPRGSAPWRLVAIDILARGTPVDSSLQARISGLSSTAGSAGPHRVPFNTREWTPHLSFTSGSTSYDTTESSIDVGLGNLGNGGVEMRIMPGTDGPGLSLAEPAPLPILVTKALARHLDLAEGSALQFTLDSGATVSGVVAGVVPLIPGTQAPFGIFANLNGVNDYLLRNTMFIPAPNQMWLAGSVTSDAALATAGPNATAPASDSTARANASGALVLWLCGIGSLLLAAIAVGAACLSLARARRGEVVVLRAIGVSARAQAAGRLRELMSVLGLSVVLGIGAGLAVSALTVSNLARSVVMAAPSELAAPLRLALGAGVVMLGVDILVLLTIALFYTARVRRQATDTDSRLETR